MLFNHTKFVLIYPKIKLSVGLKNLYFLNKFLRPTGKFYDIYSRCQTNVFSIFKAFSDDFYPCNAVNRQCNMLKIISRYGYSIIYFSNLKINKFVVD